MKFGKRLKDEAVPGWRYIDYGGLKLKLKALTGQKPNQGGAKSFAQALLEEIQAVERFLDERQQAAQDRLESLEEDLLTLQGWVESQYPDTEKHLDALQAGFNALGLEVSQLLQFLELNVTATRKILKKYDHTTGHHAGPGLLTGEGGSCLERLSDPFELSEMVVAIQAGLQRNYVLRNTLHAQIARRRELLPSRTASSRSCEIESDDEGLTRPAQQQQRRPAPTTEDADLKEKQMTLNNFLARQLLVSQRALRVFAEEADVQSARETRRLSRGERGMRWADSPLLRGRGASGGSGGLLRETRSSLPLHIIVVMTLSGLYAANVGALPPFSDLYAVMAGTRLPVCALAFATMAGSAWLALFALMSMGRDALFLPVTIAATAVMLGNLFLARVFSAYPGFDDSAPLPDPARHRDLVLFAGLILLGVGGLFSHVIPAVTCTRMQLVQTRRVEPVASSMVLAALTGSVLGTGISTVSVAGELQASLGAGMELNSFSMPVTAFGAVWLVLLGLGALPTMCSALSGSGPALHIRHAWSSSLGHSRWWGALAAASLGPNEPSWGSALALQVVSAFALALTGTMVPMTAAQLYFVPAPVLALLALLWACTPALALVLGWLLVSSLGSWFVLRVALAITALLASLLMPLGAPGSAYTLSWFLPMTWLLALIAGVVQCVSCVAISKTIESRGDELPLREFGLVGPMMAVQTARYLGAALAFVFVALTFTEDWTASTTALNNAFLCVAAAHAGCFFVLLWEDH